MGNKHDAAEIWAAAQLAPGEGIEDGVSRVAALLTDLPPLPEYSDVLDKFTRGFDLEPVEQFIMGNEPADADAEDEFRESLQLALHDYARAAVTADRAQLLEEAEVPNWRIPEADDRGLLLALVKEGLRSRERVVPAQRVEQAEPVAGLDKSRYVIEDIGPRPASCDKAASWNCCSTGRCEQDADERLARDSWESIATPPAVPVGWKLVPIRNTTVMDQAAFGAAGCPSDWYGFDEMYSAALAVAPKPDL